MRARGDRIYPYSNGLLLGCEVDVVLANENSEPVNAEEVFKKLKLASFGTRNNGGEEDEEDEGDNLVKVKNGMVRMYSRQSYCRAYATDNVWWMMKTLVAKLKSSAHLSYVPSLYGEDFDGMPDDKAWNAAGHMKCSIRSSLYSGSTSTKLHTMTYTATDESHNRLKDNMRLVIGLIDLLLDRRESAAFRRQEYGPFSNQEFRLTDNFLTYQTPTNWWIFSPILAHLMFGLTRLAYFITVNEIEKEIWEGFEPGDIKHAIHNSSYDTGEEIWELVNGRLSESGYKQNDNPLWSQRGRLIEFLMKYGVGTIGDGIYKNWKMSRKMNNYQGHFADIPGWENGAFKRVFTEKHPKRKLLAPFLGETDAK